MHQDFGHSSFIAKVSRVFPALGSETARLGSTSMSAERMAGSRSRRATPFGSSIDMTWDFGGSDSARASEA